MENLIAQYGFNAGRIWRALNDHGPLTIQQLLMETGLRSEDLFAAVGWLAREDKITKEGTLYRLDKTNLTDEIGTSAGKVWDLLKTWNEVNVAHIPDFLDTDEQKTFEALGWLAREGKIVLTKQKRVVYE